MRAVGVQLALAAALLVPLASSAGLAQTRVVPAREVDVAADTLLLRLARTGNEDEVLRIINELRRRETRIMDELRRTSLGERDARAALEQELARVSREAFSVMSVLESRCRDQAAAAPSGYLGVNITTDVRISGTRTQVHSSVIESVEPGSPAEQAGLRSGDRLVSIGGRDTRDRFPELAGVLEAGKRVVVRVNRDGRELDVPVLASARPDTHKVGCPQLDRAMQPLRMGGLARVWVRDSTDAEGARRVYVVRPTPAPRAPSPPRAGVVSAVAPVPPTPAEAPAAPAAPSVFIYGARGEEFGYFAGAQFRALDEDWRNVLGIRAGIEGVLVNDVAPGSLAAQSGLRKGDVITRVGDAAATSPLVVTRLLGLSEQPSVPVRIVRARDTQTITFRVSAPPR